MWPIMLQRLVHSTWAIILGHSQLPMALMWLFDFRVNAPAMSNYFGMGNKTRNRYLYKDEDYFILRQEQYTLQAKSPEKVWENNLGKI